MARKIVFLDDLDDTPNAETIRIGLHGEWREIDLAPQNQERLEQALDKFWSAARQPSDAPAGSRRSTGKASAKAKSAPQSAAQRFTRPAKPVEAPVSGNGGEAVTDKQVNAQIREWAKERGIEVADRGRIPADVRDQFFAERSNGGSGSHAETPAAPTGTPAARKATKTVKAPVTPANELPTGEEADQVYAQVGNSLEGFRDAFRTLNLSETDARRSFRAAAKRAKQSAWHLSA